MNGYLLDTNVISLFAPGRQQASQSLAEWMEREGAKDRLFISVISVSEIRRGITKLERRGEEKRALFLNRWLEQLVAMFSDRILPVDLVVGEVAGKMNDAADAKGRNPGFADILIAASARVHDLTVVTQNTKHFEPLDIRFSDPLDVLTKEPDDQQ